MPSPTTTNPSCNTIEKHSKQRKASRRMASSDVQFIHLELEVKELAYSVILMVLTNDCSGWMDFGREFDEWWSSHNFSRFRWKFWRILRVGRRNEEETTRNFLSKPSSSPTAAITLLMMSCGISIAFGRVWKLVDRIAGFHASAPRTPASACKQWNAAIKCRTHVGWAGRWRYPIIFILLPNLASVSEPAYTQNYGWACVGHILSTRLPLATGHGSRCWKGSAIQATSLRVTPFDPISHNGFDEQNAFPAK